MKQIFNTNLGIRTKEVPIPTPTDNEILIKVKNSLISLGTETSSMKSKSSGEKIKEVNTKIEKLLKILKDNGPKQTFEKVYKKLKNSKVETSFSPIGYSNSGVVVSVGHNITNINVGDRVACGGNGYAVHGDYAIVPKNLVVTIPKNVSFREASFTTVGSIAMQGLRRANVEAGETIIIYGLGLMGLLAVQIAKVWGYKVIGLDINDYKVNLALKYGADFSFNILKNNNIESKINKVTKGRGADASVIYASTTSSDPINNSFKYCRVRSNIVIVGAVGMNLVRDDFYGKEQNLLISTSYGPGRYDKSYEEEGKDYPLGFVRWTENRNMEEFVDLLNNKKINVNALITKVESPSNAYELYSILASKENKNIAVIFQFLDEKVDKKFDYFVKIELKKEKKLTSKEIKTGFVGVGGYIANYLLPVMKKDYFFNAIANKTPQSTLKIAHEFKIANIYGDYQKLLEDHSNNLIVIGTRHNLHAKIVIDSLVKGFNVFVEKPLGLKFDEIIKIKALSEKANKRVFVGFNRRYSIITQELLKETSKSNQPLIITYRINAGRIPPSSWVQNPKVGGGRIIGEGCHFIDYCNYIAQSLPQNINIKVIPKNSQSIVADDNYILTITYESGSIATIIYASIGDRTMTKEYIEVFQDGYSYIIDDFLKLELYQNGTKKEIKLKEQDKGREKQMLEIAKFLQGKKSLIPDFSFDLNASLMAINAQNILNGTED